MTQSEREILDREYNARESGPSFAAEYARYVAASSMPPRCPPAEDPPTWMRRA